MDGYNATTAEVARSGIGVLDASRSRGRFGRVARHWWPFLLCVVLPTAAGATYELAIASDQYISEAEFIVRSPSHASPGMLAGLLQTSGLSKATDDTYAVNEYLTSRDALQELVAHDDLREIYAHRGADLAARFPPFWSSNTAFERLFDYYQDHVDVLLDSGTGVTTLKVRAFTPEDAQRLASALLTAGEHLVNRLNDRAMTDAMASARKEVARLEDRETELQAKIAQFRNRETVIDPGKQSQTMLQGIAELQRQLAETQTFITVLSRTSPGSPQLPSAQRRAAAIQAQITEEQSKITGSNQSMVPRISEYDTLQLQREFADKALSSALASLESARADAERQHLYLERVVEPNLSDYSLYPKRIRTIAIVFATFLGLYLIGKVVISGVREHQAH